MNAERREYLEMQLSAYLDGELTPQEQAEVEAWLAADPEARRLLAQLRATVEAVQSLPRARASEELLGNLRTRLERKALLDAPGPAEVVTRTPTPSWGKWVAAAAVIALTVTAGYFTWTLRSEQQVGGTQLASRDRKEAAEPEFSAATERTKQDIAPEELFKHREAGDTTLAAGPAVSPPASASPARKPSERAPGGAPALPAPGKPLASLNEGESVRAEQGKKGDSLAEAPAARGAVADALIGGAEKDVLGDKKPDMLSFAGRPEGRSAESGGIQQQYATALVPGADLAEGRTRVLTFSFADASSRSKAIESLQRELLQGEGNEEAKSSAGVPHAPRRSVAAPQETHPAEMAPQPSAQAGDSVRHRRQELGVRSLRDGGTNGVVADDWGAAPGAVKVASIDTNPDSAVNVLKVVTVNGASADRLMAVLNNRDWSAGRHRYLAEDAEAVQLRDHKAKEDGPGPDRRPTTTVFDDAADRVWDDDDGDGVSDWMKLPTALPKPPATQPSRKSLYLSDADTISPLDGKMTWDLARIFENGGRDDVMTDEEGVANQVYDMALRPDRSIVLDTGAEPHATTSPADSPQDEASYGTGGMGMMGGAVAGTGLEGMGAGYGGYAAAQSKGSTPRYAGSWFGQSSSQPASAGGSRPADSNLLVVYFEVLSPDTQPTAASSTSAPASADLTSQPAANP
ncbi:MAG TPA: hypothetical protein PLL20_16125 [Phycisphaerae bacterium]|nr:hypothetical protein [Phycisphaerae bacterium]